jgi:TolB-like protein
VLIELPRGSYAVVWSYAASRDATATAAPLRTARWRQVGGLLAAGAMLVMLAVIVSQQRESGLARDYPTFAEALAQGRPPIVVVPFEDLGGEARSRSLADTLTEEVLIELDEHELFVIATEPRGSGANPAAALPTAAGYVLSGSVRSARDTIRITARLVLASTGTQIWSARFDEPRSIETARAEQERVARAVAAVAAPYGPVFDAELARVMALPPERPGMPDCMLAYYQYRREIAPALHASALRCFERVTESEPRRADAWGAVAMLHVDAFGYGYDSATVSGAAALDRAREAARTAMDIDGDNLFANVALARVLFFSRAEFERAAEQALARHPNNTDALALVSTIMILDGDLTRGSALADRAIELSPRPPGTYYASKAFAHLRSGKYDEALAAALRIDAPNWVIGHGIVASIAALAGRDDIAVRARDRLAELSPAGGQEPRALIERWPMAERLRAEFTRGLDLADSIGAQP